MKELILKTKCEHPDWGYKKISKLLNIPLSTIRYYLDPKAKEKTIQRVGRYRNVNPLCSKLTHFREIREKKKNFDKTDFTRRLKSESLFTTTDLLTKFGENPTCYLTGDLIDLDKVSTYEFDHIQPVSKGGNNSLKNLGLTTREANRAKNDMALKDFLFLCQKVLTQNGFRVEKLG